MCGVLAQRDLNRLLLCKTFALVLHSKQERTYGLTPIKVQKC